MSRPSFGNWMILDTAAQYYDPPASGPTSVSCCARMSDQTPLQAAICAKIEGEDVPRVGEEAFFFLFQLDSEIRYGLDGTGRWCLVAPDENALRGFAPGTEAWFIEWLEHARADIESAARKGAESCGLSVDLVEASIPAVELVRAVIVSRSVYGCRQALRWLLPSELRAVRAELAELAEDAAMPQSIRELARHLVVTE